MDRRAERRGPAFVAPFEQQSRGGVQGPLVGRMRLGAEPAEVRVDEAGVDRPGLEFRTAQEPAQEGEIGLRPDDHRVVELLEKRSQRLGPARPMDDHLGDHRIVIGCDGVARGETGVDPDAVQPLLALEVHDMDATGRGQEAMLRVLGVDARFDRRARRSGSRFA